MTFVDYWSFILGLICLNGFRRMLLWHGSGGRKFIYILFLLIISLAITFFLAPIIWFMDIGKNPLLFNFILLIIFYIKFNRSAQIWIFNGLLPFSKGYPKKENKDWEEMSKHERIILIGILISSISFEISITSNSIIMLLRMLLIWIGIFTIIIGFYLKYSEPKLLIGFSSIIFGLWIPFFSSYSIILIWLGVGFLIWGYLAFRKNRKLV